MFKICIKFLKLKNYYKSFVEMYFTYFLYLLT